MPWYVHRYGVSLHEILLTLFFILATGLGITVGYHRYFAHATFKTHPVIEFLILFFGAAAFEQSALTWSSGHRDHHRYVDTDLDPYSIKKGFWYAHIGWMTLWKQAPDYRNAKDLLKNKIVMHQHYHYPLWGLVSGILLPVLIGALMGHALGALILAVFFRISFVYHATFCINSVCHTFGKATYDIHATARDHWFVAILTNGEGYHNFHHRFPTDYRNGIRWYHWDPSKWLIAGLSRLGLAWDLKQVSGFSILQARLAAENQSLHEKVTSVTDPHRFAHLKEVLHLRYAALCQKLAEWESTKIERARIDFEKARRDWQMLVRAWMNDSEFAFAGSSDNI